MRMSDLIPAAFILALSVLVLFGSWGFAYWTETAPGPAFLPYWLAGAGFVLFGLRLIEVWREGGNDDAGSPWPERAALLRVILTFAGLIAIPILSPVLGMLPGVVLFMGFLLIVLLRRPLLPSLATIAVTGGIIYVIFVLWLGVPLPTGAIGL